MVTNGQTTAELAAIVAEAIPVALIDPSPFNRQCGGSDDDIAGLASTIENGGLIAPISARPRDGGRYEIICGERRWRAFRLLERKMIPCVIKDLDDNQTRIEQIGSRSGKSRGKILCLNPPKNMLKFLNGEPTSRTGLS